MSYKTIAVHLDINDLSRSRLELARGLATQFEAHLTGIYADFLLPQSSLCTYGEVVDLGADIVKFRSENAHTIEKVFNQVLVAAALSGNWIAVDLDPVRSVAQLSRCADLLIIGQHDPSNKQFYPGYHFPQSVLLSAGVPMLLIPYAGNVASFGNTVLVAWDGSRESCRALHDALPFLKRAKEITVFTVNAKDNEAWANRCSGEEVIQMLSRHNVSATWQAVEGVTGGDTGNVILSAISDANADLLVIGGYGHSRLQEIVLGGVTKTVLHTASIPVLLSH